MSKLVCVMLTYARTYVRTSGVPAHLRACVPACLRPHVCVHAWLHR